MEKQEKKISLEEVKALVKNAYEVGYCDGVDSDGSYSPDSSSFWNSHVDDWLNKEITYIV